MSVVNNMLRNLDNRHGQTSGQVANGSSLRAVDVKPRWPFGVLQSVVIALALFAGGVAAWWMFKQPLPSAVIAASPPQVIAAVPLKPTAPLAAPSAAATPDVAPALAVVADAAAPQPPAMPKPIATPERPSVAAAVAAPAPAPAPAPTPTAAPVVTATPRPRLQVLPTHVAAAPADSTATPTRSAPSAVSTPSAATTPPLKAVPSVDAKPASPSRQGVGKTYSTAQVASNLQAEATALEREGRIDGAMQPLQRLLALNPSDVQTRLTLARLHAETGRVDSARTLLAEGHRLMPEQSAFAMALARLRVDAGDVPGAIETLEAGSAGARDDPAYRAFLGALLLRVQRYDEAVRHYQVALRADPGRTPWLVGMGVALEGIGRVADAVEAYRRVSGASDLAPDSAQFVAERLERLKRRGAE